MIRQICQTCPTKQFHYSMEVTKIWESGATKTNNYRDLYLKKLFSLKSNGPSILLSTTNSYVRTINTHTYIRTYRSAVHTYVTYALYT